MLRAIAGAGFLAGVMALMLPALALAQDHQDHRGGPPPRGAPPHGPVGGPPHGPPGGPPRQGPMMPQHTMPRPGGPGPSQQNRVFVPGHQPGPVAGPQFHQQGPVARPQFGPAGQTQFHYHGRAFNPVRVSPFIYPRGWGYRRWGVGAVLPPIFLAPIYYYTDWAALGLDPPPPDTQWVRYGPDLLLVDVTTGSVIEVVPDVFYE